MRAPRTGTARSQEDAEEYLQTQIQKNSYIGTIYPENQSDNLQMLIVGMTKEESKDYIIPDSGPIVRTFRKIRNMR